jgi:hypothetical protein
LDLELSAEDLKTLDGASQIDLGFSQSIDEREMARGVSYGGPVGPPRSPVRSGYDANDNQHYHLSFSFVE